VAIQTPTAKLRSTSSKLRRRQRRALELQASKKFRHGECYYWQNPCESIFHKFEVTGSRIRDGLATSSLDGPWADFCRLQSDAPVTIRTRKFITNRLLQRRQMIVDVLHPGRPNVSKKDLSEKLGQLYKADASRVVPFGFRTHFGGGRSTGFVLIYDDEPAQKRFEPRYRLVRVSGLRVFRLAWCS